MAVKNIFHVPISITLGFSLGFTLSGTVDHYYIPPKPLRVLLTKLNSDYISNPSKFEQISDVTEDRNRNKKFRYRRSSLFQIEWNGSITEYQADVQCKVLTPSKFNDEESMLMGILVKNPEKKNEWLPVVVSLVTPKNKEILIHDAFLNRSKRRLIQESKFH